MATATKPWTARTNGRVHKWLAMFLSGMLLAGGLVATVALPASAVGITANQDVTKQTVADGTVERGETFVYRFRVSCGTSLLSVTGCGESTIVDLLPEWIDFVSAADFPPSAPGTLSVAEVDGRDQVTFTFTSPVSIPEASTGLPIGTYELNMTVRLAADAPWELDGTTVVNVADLTSTNAEPAQSQSDVVPEIPLELNSAPEKAYSPSENVATPGLATELTLKGQNLTNGGVSTLSLQDPAGAGNPAVDTTNPFYYLEFTDFAAVTMPAGADAIEAQVYTESDGWVTVYSGAGPPTYPATGAPSKDDVYGVRYTFSSSSNAIERGANASAALALANRANVTSIGSTGVTVDNTVTSTVTVGDQTLTSAPATAQYTVLPYALGVEASKLFTPNQVKVGDTSTVIVRARNANTARAGSLTITEPGTATPSALSGPLEFKSFGDGVRWPAGATSVNATYTYADGSTDTPSTTTANTVPAPDAARRLVGFELEFVSTTGMNGGAEALIPFIVDTDNADPAIDLTTVPNEIDVSAVAFDTPDVASATADDELEIFGDRLGVNVSKLLGPTSTGWLTGGQTVTAQIPATVADFPTTTVEPTQVIVSDAHAHALSADWWNLFNVVQLPQLGIPTDASLTVQYTTDAGGWTDLPGAIGLTGGGGYQTVVIDATLAPTITGLQFIYTALTGESFAPGTTFQPNISFASRSTVRSGPFAGQPIADYPTNAVREDGVAVVEVANCAQADASSTGLAATPAETDPCPTMTFVPFGTPGTGDGTQPILVAKSLTPATVVERTQGATTGTINWSTDGLTGVNHQTISDLGSAAGPGSGSVAASYFDAFDLVSLGRITTTSDPLMRYDQIQSIKLYDTRVSAWVDVPGGPWDGPTAAGGVVFGGYTVPVADREYITGVQYTVVESPNRVNVVTPGNLTQPAVGSGVAASTTDRPITMAFQLRDTRRSDGAPALWNSGYNAGPSVVLNTASSTACLTADESDCFTSTSDDSTSLLNGTATVTTVKDWTGGPLGLPAAGTLPANYPSTQVTLDVTSNGPQKVDSLLLSDPAVGAEVATGAFNYFDLTKITSLTVPASATSVTATLTHEGGATSVYASAADVLALTPTDLADVVGISVLSEGRINPGGKIHVGMDMQLRAEQRDGSSITQTDNIPNTLFGSVFDPSVEPEGSCEPYTVEPDANTVISCAQVSIDLLERLTLTVDANKSFPDALQYEDETDRFQMIIGGQPAVVVEGQNPPTARANQVVLTDDSPAFWNAYAFAGLSNASGAQFDLAAPVNRVQIEVLTGGAYSVDTTGNSITRTDGAWSQVTGGLGGSIWMTAAQARTALPSGDADTQFSTVDGTVSYADVQGLRITYQRVAAASIADSAASLLLIENPSIPNLRARVLLDRRPELVTGGEVPTTLPGTTPAPGTTTAGFYPNTVRANASGPSATAIESTADATMELRHRPTRVNTSKLPVGSMTPGNTFTVSLTSSNTGSYPIIDPVIVDDLPTGGVVAGLPDYVFPLGVDPTDVSNYTFSLAGGAAPGSPWTSLPIDPADVTITAVNAGGTNPEPTQLRFTFDDGAALGIGQEYVITWKMRLRPGALAGETYTNEFGISGERDFDTCNNVDGLVETCSADATITTQPVGALSMYQTVKADDPELGVVSTEAGLTCSTADADDEGFYREYCTPVTKPGETNTWRLNYTNTGTYPIESVYGINYLPVAGPSGITISSETNEWWARLIAGTFNFPGRTIQPTVTYYYTTEAPGSALCTASLSVTLPGDDPIGACPAGSWYPLTPGDSVDRSTITAVYFDIQFDPAEMYNPGDEFYIEYQTLAPAYGDTTGTDGLATTWSSGYTNAAYLVGDEFRELLPFEVPVVGATLAEGSITLVKQLTGAAQDETWVPDEFGGQLSCISAGQQVPQDRLPVVPTLSVGDEVTLDGIPWGAECSFVETDAGSDVTVSPTTVTATDDVEAFELQTVTNAYEYGSLTVRKDVEAETGFDIPADFEFTAVCTYLGNTVLDETFTLDDNEERTFEGLPARATCEVTETNAHGANTTQPSVVVVDPAAAPVIDIPVREVTIPLLSPDAENGDAQNTVTFTNNFGVGAIDLVKTLSGGGAATVAADTSFELGVVCTYGAVTIVDETVVLSAATGWRGGLSGILTGAECTVTEPDLAGADAVVLTPNDGTNTTTGTVQIDEEAVVSVTADNWFLTRGLDVTKVLSGDGADSFGQPGNFVVLLACTLDGEPLEIAGGAERLVRGGETASYTGLPSGAECTISETDTGGAGASRVLNEEGQVVAEDATLGYTFTVEVDPTLLIDDDQPSLVLDVENAFDLANVSVSKAIESTAINAEGEPVPFGPFEVTIACTFDGRAALPNEPVTRVISELETVTWSGLPAGAECEVTETDTGAASSTLWTSWIDGAVVADDEESNWQDGAVATLGPLPAITSERVAHVAFLNVYLVGAIKIAKELTGNAASSVTRTFPVGVSCVLLDAKHPEGYVVRDEVVEIGGPSNKTAMIENLPLGTVCAIEETETGGAASTSIRVRADEPMAKGIDTEGAKTSVSVLDPLTIVTVTNRFHRELPATGVAMTWTVPLSAVLLMLLGALIVTLRRRRRS